MDVVAARSFAKKWSGGGRERQDTSRFWTELFQRVLEVEDVFSFASFEKKVKVPGLYNGPRVKDSVMVGQGQLPVAAAPAKRKSTDKGIDVYIPSAKVIIEQKSSDKSLDARYRQSDGLELKPYEQAFRYNTGLRASESARYIITCNFTEMRIYDLDHQEKLLGNEPVTILLSELPDKLGLLDFLVREHEEKLEEEAELSHEAAVLMAKLHRQMVDEYRILGMNEDDIPTFMVRMLFCLYAEDSGMFKYGQFKEYLRGKAPDQQTGEFRAALIRLFEVLNTPVEERDRFLPGELADFKYVNGGLFADKIDVPFFTIDSKHTLLHECASFDWHKISPVQFGDLFESVLSSEKRHQQGMHYTSPKCIRKLTRPLFLDRFEGMLLAAGNNEGKLRDLQNELANSTWLDSACGSGNFLSTSFIDLRRLENRILERLVDPNQTGQAALQVDDRYEARVSINQFYGIELDPLAVAVANAAMQIANHQMNLETSEILGREIDSLPLTKQTGIIQGDALEIDWNGLLPAEKCTYIIGNPPWLGARTMSPEQKAQLQSVAKDVRNNHDLDYVAAWYIKAADMMDRNPGIETALVSTNSICQGAQPGNLWAYLMEKRGVEITFAWRTFVWNSEAADPAHVHCVIVGFKKGSIGSKVDRVIYDGDGVASAGNINGYLLDAPNIFVRDRKAPLCDVPKMANGNQPRDDGHLILKPDERDVILAAEPDLERFVRPYVGSDEFIKGKIRYCLWLEDATPDEIAASPVLSKRVKAVYDFRTASKAKTTKGYAKTPALFAQRPQEQGVDFLLIPMTSSERREYLPIGYMSKEHVASNAAFVIPRATLYHFGILASQAHNAWMRAVAGRLESRYRYSKEIVYNCFPWPEYDEKKAKAVEKAARGVLSARANHPGTPPSVLYDPEKLPIYSDLLAAHRALDRAVEAAYGVKFDGDEDKIVTHLFKLYAEMVESEDE